MQRDMSSDVFHDMSKAFRCLLRTPSSHFSIQSRPQDPSGHGSGPRAGGIAGDALPQGGSCLFFLSWQPILSVVLKGSPQEKNTRMLVGSCFSCMFFVVGGRYPGTLKKPTRSNPRGGAEIDRSTQPTAKLVGAMAEGRRVPSEQRQFFCCVTLWLQQLFMANSPPWG